jgi:ATP-dependent Clp protease protease subunit
LHQSSGGFSGNIQDAEVDWQEWQKINDELFILLGNYCNKKADQVKKDATRDFWLTANEALAYGIIDEVIAPKR